MHLHRLLFVFVLVFLLLLHLLLHLLKDPTVHLMIQVVQTTASNLKVSGKLLTMLNTTVLTEVLLQVRLVQAKVKLLLTELVQMLQFRRLIHQPLLLTLLKTLE